MSVFLCRLMTRKTQLQQILVLSPAFDAHNPQPHLFEEVNAVHATVTSSQTYSPAIHVA